MTTETTTPVAAPAATKPVKAPKAKKTAKKAAAKKATKKPAAKKTEQTRDPNALGKVEQRILTVLARNSNGLNRAALKEKAEVQSGLSKIIGASTKDDLGVNGSNSLQARKLVRAEKHEGEGLLFIITAAGRKALEASKE